MNPFIQAKVVSNTNYPEWNPSPIIEINNWKRKCDTLQAELNELRLRYESEKSKATTPVRRGRPPKPKNTKESLPPSPPVVTP